MRIYRELPADASAPHTAIREARWLKTPRIFLDACVLDCAKHKSFISVIILLAVFTVSTLCAAFPLWKHASLAVSWRCRRLCSRFNYHPVIAVESERSWGMHRRDDCQASLQSPSAPSTPQTRKGGAGWREGLICGTTLWAGPSATALFVARSPPDVPSVSKQEWLCEGNFQQFVRF